MFSLEEKKTTGNLISFIDLLFLVVCFFIFLLNQTSQKAKERENEVSIIEQQLTEIKEEFEIAKKTIEQMQPLAEMASVAETTQKKEEAYRIAKMDRLQSKPVKRLSYSISNDGSLVYEGNNITVQYFIDQIVHPMRKHSWIAFRAYASPEIPFGKVVEIRNQVLKRRGEFDTFWSNLDTSNLGKH